MLKIFIASVGKQHKLNKKEQDIFTKHLYKLILCLPEHKMLPTKIRECEAKIAIGIRPAVDILREELGKCMPREKLKFQRLLQYSKPFIFAVHNNIKNIIDEALQSNYKCIYVDCLLQQVHSEACETTDATIIKARETIEERHQSALKKLEQYCCDDVYNCLTSTMQNTLNEVKEKIQKQQKEMLPPLDDRQQQLIKSIVKCIENPSSDNLQCIIQQLTTQDFASRGNLLKLLTQNKDIVCYIRDNQLYIETTTARQRLNILSMLLNQYPDQKIKEKLQQFCFYKHACSKPYPLYEPPPSSSTKKSGNNHDITTSVTGA